ncbi:MAG: hypothetical protein JO121_22440 [Deltaproteobacteria bacterium]|nr:hypothetical protein [Deltaproteobacteria bacterium]
MNAKLCVQSIVLLALLVTIGCGAHPAGAAESSSGVTVSGNTVTRNGCTVDLARVCRDYLDQRWIVLSNLPRPGRYLRVQVPYNYPDGRPLATIYCEFDMSSHSVTRARLGSEPPIDDRAVEFVRSQGLCLQNRI